MQYLTSPNLNFSSAQGGHNSANFINFHEIIAVKHSAPFLVLKQTLVAPVIDRLIFITQAASFMLGEHWKAGIKASLCPAFATTPHSEAALQEKGVCVIVNGDLHLVSWAGFVYNTNGNPELEGKNNSKDHAIK